MKTQKWIMLKQIRNEYITESLRVTNIPRKMRKNRKKQEKSKIR